MSANFATQSDSFFGRKSIIASLKQRVLKADFKQAAIQMGASAVTGAAVRFAFTTAAITVFGSTVPLIAVAAGAGLVVGVAVSGVKEAVRTYNSDLTANEKLKNAASSFVNGIKNNGAKAAVIGLIGGIIGYELADFASQFFAAQPSSMPSVPAQTTPVIEAASASNQTASGAMPNLSNLRLPNGSLLNDFMNNSSAPNGSSTQQILTTAPVETSAPAPAALTPVPPVVEAPATPSAPAHTIQSHLEIKGKTGWYLRPTPSVVNGEHILTQEYVRLENGVIKGGETVVEGMKIDTSIEGGHAYSKFVIDAKGAPVDLNNACARAQAFYVGTNGWSFDAIKQTLGQKYNFLNYYNPNYSGDLAGKMHFNGKIHNISDKICGVMDWSRSNLNGHKADMTGYLGDTFVAHFNGSAADLANCEPCRNVYSNLISACNTKVCAIA